MEEYKKDDRGRSKAKRLTEADPHTKVDSSTWTPPEAENAGVKTGARPLVKRLYKKGGKVVGKHEGKDSHKHGGRMPRKTGGRTNTLSPDSLINRDVRTANEVREGEKHVGGFKKGGRAHKFGGGMMGDNPVSQQNQMMGKASGMMKKGGKVRHRADGGSDEIGDLIKRTPNPLPRGMAGRGMPTSGEPSYHTQPEKPYKYTGPAPTTNPNAGQKRGGRAEGGKWIQGAIKHPGSLHKALHVPKGEKIPVKKLHAAEEKGGKLAKKAHLAETLKHMHHAKGGKAGHPDEAEDKKLMHKILKPKAFKADGGSAHSKDCTCKMCWGGRTKKYAGGGIFSGDSKSKVPGAVGGRKAHAGGGRNVGYDESAPEQASYNFLTGWSNLDKALPDQIAHMNEKDRAAALAAQGNAPVRMGATPNTSSSTTYRRPAPAPTGKGGMGSNPTMDPAQRAEAAAQMIGSGRGISGPTAEDIANYQRPTGAAGTVTSPYDVYSSNQAGPQTGGFNTSEAARMAQARRLLANHPEMNAAPINQKLNPGGYYTSPTGFGALDRTASDVGSYLYDQMRSADQPAGYKKGGKVGKTNVNIIIATGKGGQPQGMMGGAPMPNAPVSPRIPQQQPQMPQGGMPPQGMPPMPPQGGMPMPRKHGGRTGYPIDSGAGGGEARLEKRDAYGLKPARKAGGRTGYPIETGSGGGEARLDKVKAYGLTPPKRK